MKFSLHNLQMTPSPNLHWQRPALAESSCHRSCLADCRPKHQLREGNVRPGHDLQQLTNEVGAKNSSGGLSTPPTPIFVDTATLPDFSFSTINLTFSMRPNGHAIINGVVPTLSTSSRFAPRSARNLRGLQTKNLFKEFLD